MADRQSQQCKKHLKAAERATVRRIDPLRPSRSAIKEAVEVLDANGLVMYPTESSYALGANALEEAAVKKIFEAKGRPADKPIPVIVSGLQMWKKYAYFNKSAEILVRRFMPGPLTLALRKKPAAPDVLTPIAVAARIPGNPVALALVREAKYPITSTSANMSGRAPIYSPKRTPKALRTAIDLVLDAGTLRRRKPSTIVDLTKADQPIITREGAIRASTVLKALARRAGTK